MQRLLELGLMEGEEVLLLARAPLGDPLEIEFAQTRLSLRRTEAANVVVTNLE
jgi:Fe2+ transport system protein FeoA